MGVSERAPAAQADSKKPVVWIVLFVAAFSLAGAITVAVTTGIPRPGVADEFCYLLSADTFARLRLTNPTHSLWEHFEAFHIIHQPTYSAKYPPGQGLVLALGQSLGHPVIGVWLNSALMAAAFTWMLLGWLPRFWALFGGLLAALLFGISGVWAQTYMTGSLAATGGALLYGGVRRVVRNRRARDAVWTAVGLLVLANTRPFEGFVTSLPAAAVLLIWLLRRRGEDLRRAVRSVVLPLVLVLAVGAVWTGLHNRAVTGSAGRLPYQVHQETYPFVSLFVWEKAPRNTQYNHQYFRRFENQMRDMLMEGNPPGIRWRANQRRFRLFRDQYLPGLTWLPLVLLPLAPRSRWTLLALGTCLLLLATQLASVSVLPHYSAPIACLLVLLIVEGVRSLERLPRGRLAAVGAAILVLVGGSANTVAKARQDNSASWVRLHQWRPVFEDELRQAGGKHLVLVKYGPRLKAGEEWVYNSADIDGQAVVWAHSMGGWRDRQLLHYYRDRKFWLVELGFDEDPLGRPPLVRYQRPGLRETSEATRPGDLHLALKRLARRREPEVRAGLIRAIQGGDLGSARVDGNAGALAVGATSDSWTRGTHPAAILIRNPRGAPVVPRLRLACHARGEDLPVRVTVDDGQRVLEVVFRRGGQRYLDLSEIAAGSETLVVVSSSRAWPGRGSRPRLLGVKLQAVDFQEGAGSDPQDATSSPGPRVPSAG